MERLLLALAAHDLAKLVPPGGGEHEQNKTLPRFSNSALSATLRPEHPNYIGAFVRHQVEDMYPVWQNLAASFSPETSDVAVQIHAAIFRSENCIVLIYIRNPRRRGHFKVDLYSQKFLYHL